jgi:hypothetical protein
MTHTGSCHCGAIRFRADLDLASSTRCNCSFCSKNRFWFALVKASALEIVAGADQLADYQHGDKRFLHFLFCRTCGVRPFSKGGHLPQMGGEFYAVNVAALDLTPEQLAAIPVTYADGAHDDWGTAPKVTSYM